MVGNGSLWRPLTRNEWCHFCPAEGIKKSFIAHAKTLTLEIIRKIDFEHDSFLAPRTLFHTPFYCQLVLSSTGLVMVTATHLVHCFLLSTGLVINWSCLVHCFLLSTGLVMVTVTHLVDVILVKKKHSTHLEYTAMLHGSFDLMWSLLFRCVSLPNLRFGHTCNTDRRGCSNHSAAEVEDHLQSLYSHELCN